MSAFRVALTQIGVAIVLAMLCAGDAFAQDSDLARAEALNQQIIQLYNQGRYGDAVPVAKEVLVIREKALGPEHPDVALSLSNLAELYQSQDRYAEAEPLLKRCLAISEKAFGPEHPDVVSLNNLAGLYRNQGRYAEAEQLYKRSLAIREKALGREHPDVGQSLNDLAVLYQSQGRYAEAEPLYKRSRAIREKALGPEHPLVAVSLNNLALVELAALGGKASPDLLLATIADGSTAILVMLAMALGLIFPKMLIEHFFPDIVGYRRPIVRG
jgi:tetratricopeptide (TPR) repeat protein